MNSTNNNTTTGGVTLNGEDAERVSKWGSLDGPTFLGGTQHWTVGKQEFVVDIRCKSGDDTADFSVAIYERQSTSASVLTDDGRMVYGPKLTSVSVFGFGAGGTLADLQVRINEELDIATQEK